MESQRNLRDRNHRMDCTSKKILIFSEMVDVRKSLNVPTSLQNLISKGDKCDSLNRWKGFISSGHPLEV